LSLAVVGTTLVVAGANTLNMFLERDLDAKMERTRTRPLPSGRLRPEIALFFGLTLTLLGQAMLTRWVNAETGMLAASAWVLYVWAYTPLKSRTPYALHVGAIPGAIPPLIGWAAVTGGVDHTAWVLFLILFAWQLPHFVAISVYRQAEYARAGLQVGPVAHGADAGWRSMARGMALMLAVSVLPFWTPLFSVGYACVAGAFGLFWAGVIAIGLRHRSDAWAKRSFFASLPYLVAVLTALALGAP
jgi:protoheme IX farnesyltransferase